MASRAIACQPSQKTDTKCQNPAPESDTSFCKRHQQYAKWPLFPDNFTIIGVRMFGNSDALLSEHQAVCGFVATRERGFQVSDVKSLRSRGLLKITAEERGNEVFLVLEGRLEQPLVPELERAFTQQQSNAAGRPVIVDLFGLTGMDAAGESSLQKLYQCGATLRCGDVMNEYLVERIAHGAMKPLRAPCRPYQSNETEEIQQMEDKQSANRDQF
jgi:hypothetical protein